MNTSVLIKTIIVKIITQIVLIITQIVLIITKGGVQNETTH